MSNVDRLLEGAVDIHVHFEPDSKVERRGDALEIAQHCKDLGMGGLVLKSHEYPTAPVAFTVSKVVPGIHLIGGLALDAEIGGLNPLAVEATAKIGGRVIWMPTYSAEADRAHRGIPGGINVLAPMGGWSPKFIPSWKLSGLTTWFSPPDTCPPPNARSWSGKPAASASTG